MPSIQPFERFHKDIPSGSTTEWFLLPEAQPDDYLDNLLITVGPDGTGVGAIEVTTARRFDVIADNKSPGTIPQIMAKKWPKGNVAIITQDSVKAVTAYRIVNISGDLFVTVRGI